MKGGTKTVRPSTVVPHSYSLLALDSPRAIFDNRFSKLTDEDTKEQIIQSMNRLSESGEFKFAQTLVIKKDGSEEIIEE